MSPRFQLRKFPSAKRPDRNHSKHHSHHSHQHIAGPQCRQDVLPPTQLDLARPWTNSDQSRYPEPRQVSPPFIHLRLTTSLTPEQHITPIQMTLCRPSPHNRHSVQQRRGFWAQQQDKMRTDGRTSRSTLRSSVKPKAESLLKLPVLLVRHLRRPTTGTTLILPPLFQPPLLKLGDEGLRPQKFNLRNQVSNIVLRLLFIPILRHIHRQHLLPRSQLLLQVHLRPPPRHLLGLPLRLPLWPLLHLRPQLQPQKSTNCHGSQALRHSVLLL